jgi:hypothetical protein
MNIQSDPDFLQTTANTKLVKMKRVWKLMLLMLGMVAGQAQTSFAADLPCRINATLRASPATIASTTSPHSVYSTLTWSVAPGPDCNGKLGEYTFSLEGRPVEDVGSMAFRVPVTRTFELKLTSLPGRPTVASTQVTVEGHPAFAMVSPWRDITDDDVAEFDAHWLYPDHILEEYKTWNAKLYKRDHGLIWDKSGERMAAMARMAELTLGLRKANPTRRLDPTRYLDHLHDLIEIALKWRDDKHPGPYPCDSTKEPYSDCDPVHLRPEAMPFEPFRAQAGVPAWGEKTLITGRLHITNEMSFSFVYGFALFARIVAENPELQERYGADAVRFTNEIIKTVNAFDPQLLVLDRNNTTEVTLKALEALRLIPTVSQCDAAYEQTLSDDPEADENTKGRYANWHQDCLDLHKGAGFPMAHNWSQWYMMGLIELWKVLDSPFYRGSGNTDLEAERLRQELPLRVSRLHRYFMNRLRTDGSGADARFFWLYHTDVPDSIDTHPEDTSHGELDMRALEVLRANMDRLNAVLPAHQQIVLDGSHLRRFANTFLQKIAAGRNLARNIEGAEGNPADLNGLCDGWVNLAVADIRVYDKCHEVSLRIVNGTQPYLGPGNHSALLMNKRWLPVEPPPLPPPPPPPPPAQCSSTQKCCEFADDGGCALCVPKRAVCQ